MYPDYDANKHVCSYAERSKNSARTEADTKDRTFNMSQPSPFDPWIECMLCVARHYRVETSPENARVLAGWESSAAGPSAPVVTDENLALLARHLGLELRFSRYRRDMLDPWRLPVVLECAPSQEHPGGQIGVLEKTDGSVAVIRFYGDKGLAVELPADELDNSVTRVVLLRPLSTVRDPRVDDYIKPYEKNWFRAVAFKDWRRYVDVIAASLLANLLALAGILFSIQVYDRVVPSQSFPTLYVLFGGVLLALFFEFVMRLTRGRVTDIIGKRADLRLSDLVYGHALRLRSDARPKSTGSFIAQIRELDSLRETVTSTTMGALVDLPFVLLFFFILWLIGGWLVLVPLAALPVLIIPGLLAQGPLSRLSQAGMLEAALRNAVLVEAIQAGEDIKLLRAEARFQNMWNQVNDTAADIGLRQRRIVLWLTSLSQETQSLVFVFTLFVGAHLVIQGDITTGVLVGASILGSRTIVPLAQWASVFSRIQQARTSYSALDELMKKPVDQEARMLHRPVLHGAYTLEKVRVVYDPENPKIALDVDRLEITPGDRIAVLGRMGSGKSTLLQVLSGLLRPAEGVILLDRTRLEQIDPADVRRDVAYLSQTAQLFYGSLRENLTIGRPLATDEEMLKALHISGALPLVQAEGHGLDYVIREGGLGLSGGQRQALLLARTILLDPRIMLLDEPTTAMDDVTEMQVVRSMEAWLEGRGLVVVTHRPAVLRWACKIMVLNNGKVVMFGPKEEVLARLQSPTQGGEQ